MTKIGVTYVSDEVVEAVHRALSFPYRIKLTEAEMQDKTGIKLYSVNLARRVLEERGVVERAGVRKSRGAPVEWRIKR